MPSAAEVFMNAVTKQTGVDPGLLGYWMNQEGTYAPRGTGDFNFLNLRPQPYDTYQSVSPGRFEQFANVNDAVEATVRRMKQPFMHPLMKAIQAGQDAAQQWKAIQGTGWDIANYKGSQFSPTTNVAFPGPDVSGAGLPAAAANAPAAADTSQYGTGDPADAVAFARKYIGTPYSWGGGSPEGPTYGTQQGANIKGFDCSGLVQSAFLHAGLHDIGRSTYQQWPEGTPVNPGGLLPGDAVYYKGGETPQYDAQGHMLPGHVALYIGNGNVIEAPQTGEQVKVVPLHYIPDYMGARRFFSDPSQGANVAGQAVAAIGHKSFPPPKPGANPAPNSQPKTPPLPAAALMSGPPASAAAGTNAFQAALNTPSTPTKFGDPFVFKPGVTQPSSAAITSQLLGR